MISKDEKNLVKILVLIAALVLTVLVGKYGIGLNILPTCPNGAIAPNSDVTQCGLIAGSDGKLIAPQPLVCGYGTKPDSTGTNCVAITTPLQSCINSGGTWNAATQFCTAPKLQVQCLDGSFTDDLAKCPVVKQTTTTSQQQFQCTNGIIVSNVNQCPALNSTSTSNSNSSNTSSFTTVLVVMAVIGVIVGSIIVFRRN